MLISARRSAQHDTLPDANAGNNKDLHETGSRIYESEVARENRPCVQTLAEPQHVTDAKAALAGHMNMMTLRRRYKATENSHRAMKQRATREGAVIHPEFDNFAQFLLHVGLRPAKEATLDRVNHQDPMYGPGKVRWASKALQANNRSTNRRIVHPDTAEEMTLTQLARTLGVKPDTMRKQARQGWTDRELVDQARVKNKGASAAAPWPPDIAAYAEARYQQARSSQSRHEWFYREMLTELHRHSKTCAGVLEEIQEKLAARGHVPCAVEPGPIMRRAAPQAFTDPGTIDELKAKADHLLGLIAKIEGHIARVREQAFLDMAKRSMDEFLRFLDKRPSDKAFACTLPGIRWRQRPSDWD